MNFNSQYNPLHLSLSDHPGMQLVATKFTGSNFVTWNRGIRMALGAKTKLGFINGCCARPDEDSDDLERWIRADFMVMCWIINSMVSEIGEGFIFVSSAKELWNEIKDRYAESNDPLIYQLGRELSNLK